MKLETQGALHPLFLGFQNMNLVCITLSPFGIYNKNWYWNIPDERGRAFSKSKEKNHSLFILD